LRKQKEEEKEKEEEERGGGRGRRRRKSSDTRGIGAIIARLLRKGKVTRSQISHLLPASASAVC